MPMLRPCSLIRCHSYHTVNFTDGLRCCLQSVHGEVRCVLLAFPAQRPRDACSRPHLSRRLLPLRRLRATPRRWRPVRSDVRRQGLLPGRPRLWRHFRRNLRRHGRGEMRRDVEHDRRRRHDVDVDDWRQAAEQQQRERHEIYSQQHLRWVINDLVFIR